VPLALLGRPGFRGILGRLDPLVPSGLLAILGPRGRRLARAQLATLALMAIPAPLGLPGQRGRQAQLRVRQVLPEILEIQVTLAPLGLGLPGRPATLVILGILGLRLRLPGQQAIRVIPGTPVILVIRGPPLPLPGQQERWAQRGLPEILEIPAQTRTSPAHREIRGTQGTRGTPGTRVRHLR